MKQRSVKIIPAILALAGVAALLVWGFMEGRKEQAMEAERERPVKAPSRVSVQGNEVVITIDQATLEKSAITLAPLAALSHRGEQRATGTVLQLAEFMGARNGYVAAKAQLEKARALLAASRSEYERLKLLNADNRNVSDKALQAAEAAWRADEATLQGATASLKALNGSVRQRWGGVIAGWLFEGSPAFDRLAQQKDLLIQVTFPPDAPVTAGPRSIQVQTGEEGRPIAARLVSPAPVTDPRIQGVSFFYAAAAQPGLLPGMNVVARIPVGPTLHGAVVPSSAVVWWQGKAWAYLQRGSDSFVRREIPTSVPVKDGFFVAAGLSPEDRVVVSGAQLLLSEESRPQTSGGEEKGDND
ncbi:hypothetical protein [Geobacter sp.]|uniref:efflux RND transporter periplasmic adaptor subunit n=1 Tax=Geobacter sp. TaxID=46610 RepID=UPI00261A543F|nr:hypothetical protein [Geobacter sp.]